MQNPSNVHCTVYRHGRKLGRIPLDDISEHVGQDHTFLWVGMYEPSLEQLAKVQEEFGLHPLAIEDAHAAHQRPKMDEYGDTLFIALRTAAYENDQLRMGETQLFLGHGFLVSVRHGPSHSYDPVRARCETMPEQLAKGPGFALYAILDFVVDNYRPVVDMLQQRFERLEEHLFGKRFSRDCLEELYDLRRQLLTLRSAALPLIDVCNALIRFHSDIIPRDSRVYFRDVTDHVIRVADTTGSISDMATAAMQVNLALVTVGQNEVVKKLAGWGAILAIPTMVFSLYGMNFRHMPELDWPWSYPLILAGVGMGCIWLYRKLKRADWL